MAMTEAGENLEGTGENPAARATVLADVLRERGALPVPELLKTFLEVLRDLELAHGEGMLHRDISPARILLDGEGWKLTDYGLAKVGTVRYMSPERCQGKALDARSDVYSLGVVLYQAATGKLPFDAEMKFQIMEAHVGTRPPPPHHINPAVSFELEQVILRALAKDPSNRFQSATEFKQALEAIAGVPVQPSGSARAETPAQPTEVSRPGEPEESSVKPRRVKPVAILIPLAAAIAVVAGLLLTGVIGTRRVPLVTGMSSDEARQMLRSKGFRVETNTLDDTLPAGTVTAQLPAAGTKGPRSRVVKLSVSTGSVEMPSLAGLTLADARAELARLALTAARADSQYTDDYPADIVVGTGLKAGTKVAPHSNVGLTVSAGRATCPECGARREAGAKYCTKCGYKY